MELWRSPGRGSQLHPTHPSREDFRSPRKLFTRSFQAAALKQQGTLSSARPRLRACSLLIKRTLRNFVCVLRSLEVWRDTEAPARPWGLSSSVKALRQAVQAMETHEAFPRQALGPWRRANPKPLPKDAGPQVRARRGGLRGGEAGGCPGSARLPFLDGKRRGRNLGRGQPGSRRPHSPELAESSLSALCRGWKGALGSAQAAARRLSCTLLPRLSVPRKVTRFKRGASGPHCRI